MIIDELRLTDKNDRRMVVDSIANPCDIVIDDNAEYHLAEYVALDGSTAENCVHEPLMVNGTGKTPSRVEDGSHYTFNGSSEVVESENLWNNTIVIWGQGNLEGNDYSRCTTGYFLFIPKGTYTITPSCNYNYAVKVHSEKTNNKLNGDIYYDTAWNDAKTSHTITTTRDGYLGIQFQNALNDEIRNQNIMLNSGTTALPYTPYFEPYIKNKGVRNEITQLSYVSQTANYGSVANGNVTLKKGIKYIMSFTTTNNGGQNYFSQYSKCLEGAIFVSSDGGNKTISFTPIEDIIIENNVIVRARNFTTKSEITNLMITTEPITQYIPSDGNYYIPLGDNLINIGSQPLRQGDTASTDGLRKNARANERIENGVIVYDSVNTTEIGEAYELPSGLVEGQTLVSSKWSVGGLQWANGQEYNATDRIRTDFIRIKPNTTYLFDKGIAYVLYKNDKTISSYNSTGTLSVSTNSNDAYIRLIKAQTTDINFELIMGESGNMPTTYKPHIADETQRYKVNATTIESVAIDGNVTQINAVIGNVQDNINTSDYDYVNAWELGYTHYSIADGGHLYRTDPFINIDLQLNIVNDILCNIYETKSYATRTNKSMSNASTNRIDFVDNDFTDVATLKQYLEANNVKIYYKKANVTPQALNMPSTTTATQCQVDIVGNVDGIDITYAKQK